MALKIHTAEMIVHMTDCYLILCQFGKLTVSHDCYYQFHLDKALWDIWSIF